MRKVILNLAITFDELIEGPDGQLDWIVKDETMDYADILNEILSDKDIIFYGRVAYEKWGNTQPEEGAPQKIREAYKLLHAKKKYVFSRTLTGDGTDTVFIGSGIKEKVLEIKAQSGKDIWLYGGAKIAATFLNLDLVDEVRLAIHPVILGKGKPLFQEIVNKHDLELIDVKSYKSGVLLVKYNVKKGV
ncbi:dihydrofolate reductase family protein [Chitinophaga varians]|uniref:dihydrofolate reductase family protein n=1 Tax=Chitinophaga varians TaxID=2202339 RepID=UPI00165EDB07|nr:dihydrofolate reductase family protein [Chitinophaga varians]MBC9913054.1 dihydrofolate reductase [Chitinophaga varians]